MTLNRFFHALWVLAWLLLPSVGSTARALDPGHHVSEYTVTAWTMEEGLPHNLVQSLAQDDDGYLWVGTWEGAARFNGRDFSNFGRQELPELPATGIRAILHGADGALLFGTAQGGVLRLDEGAWSVLASTVEQHLRVISLLRDAEGILWIGTDRSLWKLAPDGSLSDVGTALALPVGTVFSMIALDPGQVLVGSEHGVFLLGPEGLEPWGDAHGVAVGVARALVRRRDGSVVVGGDGGAVMVTPDGGITTIAHRQIEAALEDRDGVLWLSASGGGLMRYHQGVLDTLGVEQGLLGRGSQALLEDREGLLWVGTTNGLYRVSDAPAFGLNRSRGLGDDYPRTILRRRDGELYVGHALGLDHWDGSEFRSVELGGESSVLALAQAADGGLWVGTYDRGVLHLPPHSGAEAEVLEGQEALPSHHVRALLETADGSLWIGTTGGLMRHWPDGRMEQIETLHGRFDSYVRGLAPARDGGFWAGLGDGLMRWHPDGRVERWGADAEFPGHGSFDVLETASGTAFIATDQGLLRLRDGVFTRFDRQAGLPNETLFRLLQDASGALWICSNSGVFRIDARQFDELDRGTREMLSVDTLDRTSGMPSSQCNGGSGPAGDFDGQGRLWLPTALGVAVIDPVAAAARSHLPVSVRIEQVEVDGRKLAPDGPHVLDAGARRVVVRYIGLHLRAPLAVRYRYRLLGFDSNWVDAGSAIEAVYTNLPAGPLRFEVQAALAPVDWRIQPDGPVASVELQQLPPYWLKPWFIALMALLVVALVSGIVVWRSARDHRRRVRLTRIIDERTRELSEKNAALLEAGRERESLLRQLAHQATHDALTGLANRRAGTTRLAKAVQQAGASGQPLCVALMDVDHFKSINDTHGHAIGDQMLRHLATQLLAVGWLSRDDVVRHGGEEFLLLIPGLALEAASLRLHALAADIAAASLSFDGGRSVTSTVSIGVAQWQPGITPEKLVAQADRCLYLAKARGRNRVESGDG